MYRVSSTHLGADGRQVRASDGRLDHGQLTAAQLAGLLAAFIEVDPADNRKFDPYLVVTAPAAKLTVRTNAGRLVVYDRRDHFAPAHELTIAELLERLDRAPGAAAPLAVPGHDQLGPRAPRRKLALATLAVGLALNGYLLYSAVRVESVNPKERVKLLVDAREAKAKAAALAGVYATGAKTGDRVIEVGATGQVRFYEIGAQGPINDSSDRYQVGRHDNTLCLTTRESGVIDLVGERLVYYRDAYSRRRPST